MRILLSLILFGMVTLLPAQNFSLAIHGGAGTIKKENLSDSLEMEYRVKLTEALRVGHAILKNGGSSVDAVEQVIKVLEDSPLFNAGKGSVFTNAETNEMDASIMDGRDLNAGAVAGVKTLKNPIAGARLVMDKSPHVMLSGEGADQYGESQGLKVEDSSYFRIERRLNQVRKIKDKEKQALDHDEDQGSLPQFMTDQKYGTVGCVAMDQLGNLAAGTSTGGMTNKRWGRVGDSPVIGAGTYANNKTVAVSCTGHGEYFIRNVVAYDVSALMEYRGVNVQAAADRVVQEKLVDMDARGGLIAIDRNGKIAWSFNTEGMYRGKVDQDEKFEVQIYKDF